MTVCQQVLQSQAHYYANELRELCETLKSRTMGKLRRELLLLLHDSSVSNYSCCKSTAAECYYECCLIHLIAQPDFYLFPLLKEHQHDVV